MANLLNSSKGGGSAKDGAISGSMMDVSVLAQLSEVMAANKGLELGNSILQNAIKDVRDRKYVSSDGDGFVGALKHALDTQDAMRAALNPEPTPSVNKLYNLIQAYPLPNGHEMLWQVEQDNIEVEGIGRLPRTCLVSLAAFLRGEPSFDGHAIRDLLLLMAKHGITNFACLDRALRKMDNELGISSVDTGISTVRGPLCQANHQQARLPEGHSVDVKVLEEAVGAGGWATQKPLLAVPSTSRSALSGNLLAALSPGLQPWSSNNGSVADPYGALQQAPLGHRTIARAANPLQESICASMTSLFPGMKDPHAMEGKLIEPGVTTLCIRNLPPHCSRSDLVDLWPAKGSWNLLYLPWIPKRRIVRYVFINFINNEAAVHFCETWHGQVLSDKGCCKGLHIVVANIQGYESNLWNMRQGKSCCIKNASYMPILIGTDGSQLDFRTAMDAMEAMKIGPGKH
jgi:hypothetical protein